MIKIRPHHLLDIIRDFGNNVPRDEHPWGASVASVTQQLLADINQTVELVIGVDSICETCSKLNGQICEAQINNELLMRDYNDRIDKSLFIALNLSSGTQLTVTEFLQTINTHIEVLHIFDSPDNNATAREIGTKAALNKLGISKTT